VIGVAFDARVSRDRIETIYKVPVLERENTDRSCASSALAWLRFHHTGSDAFKVAVRTGPIETDQLH
jgi:hypothetical protein